MKIIRQFTLIALISLAGETLAALLPLPIPASIYGILILFTLLLSGALKTEAIRETSQFLIEIMPVLFVPAGVGLMESFGLLKESLAAYLVIMVVSTVVVMAAAGRAAQAVIRREGKKEAGLHE